MTHDFGKITSGMLLGDVTLGYARLIFDETAWDDLRGLSPNSSTLVSEVYDDLRSETKHYINNVLYAIKRAHGAMMAMKKQYGQIEQPKRKFRLERSQTVYVKAADGEGAAKALTDEDWGIGREQIHVFDAE